MAQSMVRSRFVKPEHVEAVSAALGLDKDDVLKMTMEELIAALCVAVANLHGHAITAKEEE